MMSVEEMRQSHPLFLCRCGLTSGNPSALFSGWEGVLAELGYTTTPLFYLTLYSVYDEGSYDTSVGG